MKRFTETLKWSDPWYRKLSPEAKLLWAWLVDNCDAAGVIEPDLALASFQTGHEYSDDILASFGGRLMKMSGGKYLIPKFMPFQYGQLSEACPAHKPVYVLIKKYEKDRVFNTLALGYQYPTGKEKDKEKDKRRGTKEEFMEFARSLKLPPSDGEFLFEHFEENGWKRGKDPIQDWRATMRKWKTGKWLPSLKGSNATRSADDEIANQISRQ